MKKPPAPIDPLIRARVVCGLLGDVCRRTLYERVKHGEFPPPDRPAQRRGEADLWLRSTAERGVKEYQAQRSATPPPPPPRSAPSRAKPRRRTRQAEAAP